MPQLWLAIGGFITEEKNHHIQKPVSLPGQEPQIISFAECLNQTSPLVLGAASLMGGLP